jgi:hypothetical protein
VSLVAVSPKHFVHRGVFANPQSDGTTIRVSAEIEDLSGGAPTAQVTFRLADEAGNTVAINQTTITREGSVTLTPTTALSTWSPHTPVTYTVTASMPGDEVTVQTAARLLEWKDRALINGKPIMLKGFSHHNSFGGVGVVQPARLELFQVQTARALGANFIRNAHNSFRDDLYEILTELGVLSWDESREFAVEHAGDFHDQVKQHRGHASVGIWSYCNEISCSMTDVERAGPVYRAIAKSLDPDRATSGNLILSDSRCESPLIKDLDVIGTSYGTAAAYEGCHHLRPTTPLVVSEDQAGNPALRGDQQVVPIARSSDHHQVELPFVMGWIGTWTLFDYFGEARDPVTNGRRPWPQVSSRFGAFDIAGAPKEQAWVYRANWVFNSSSFLSELEAPLSTVQASAVLVRAISAVQAVSSTPKVELFVDGQSVGVRPTIRGIANFPENRGHQQRGIRGAPPPVLGAGPLQQKSDDDVDAAPAPANHEAGTSGHTNITAVGLDSNGTQVSRHQLLNGTKPAARMAIHIDVPAKSTGTGEAMFMDGQDIALIRVQFLDDDGLVAVDDERNVTWAASGPIRIVGVSSGNNANPYQQHIQGSVYETFRGLGRVLVQSTVDCTSPNRGLARDIDATASPTLQYADACPTEPAVITARVDGLCDVSIPLPYSGLPSDHPLAVARANRLLDYTYMDQF